MYINAVHEVRNNDYVRRIVRQMRKGVVFPPIVAWGDNALNGTHRLAANALCENLGIDESIPVIDLEDLDREKFDIEYLKEQFELGNFGAIDDYLDRGHDKDGFLIN